MTTLKAVLTGLAMTVAAPALVHAAPAAPAAAAKHYKTAETSIDALLADPAAKAVLDKHIPGLSDNPQIAMVGSMTLVQLQPMKPDMLADATLAAVDADLAKLPAK